MATAGGHLWRTTWDIRDAWASDQYDNGHNGIINTLDKQRTGKICRYGRH
ncbi:hypothetical protein [Niastella vici]|nr:hypothetical protein [Niastella vici]